MYLLTEAIEEMLDEQLVSNTDLYLSQNLFSLADSPFPFLELCQRRTYATIGVFAKSMLVYQFMSDHCIQLESVPQNIPLKTNGTNQGVWGLGFGVWGLGFG